MSDEKQGYFYSKEQDEVIVKKIRDEFLRCQQQRKTYERNWELNMNFYVGNQFSYISNLGGVSEISKRFSWENQEVYNHIAPIIECRLAKLNKVKPMLNVRACSEQSEDIVSAKIAKSLIKSAFNKNSFDSLLSLATAWSEIAGTAFYKITWNNQKGEFSGEIGEQRIKSGDVEIAVCSPFEIFPSSNSVCEIEDCEFIIEAKVYPVSEINSVYGTHLVGEDIDIYDLGSSSQISSISGKSNSPKILHSPKKDCVMLIERYEKPTAANPNGKFSVICKDKLLYDGELPYKDENGRGIYPFVKQVSNKQITSFWGTSVIDRCVPLQRAYNAIKNKKHEFISRLTSGVLAVEDGSVDLDNLEDEGLAPGKILVYRNGSTPPEFLTPGNIPAELEKEEARLLAEMNNLCCVSDISVNSSFPSNVSSGSALSILIEQDESRLSLVGENIRVSVKKVGEKLLMLYKQFSSGSRIIKVANLKGNTDLVYWSGESLLYEDVTLELSNEFEESIIKQKETIISLYEKGLFADEKGEVSAVSKKNILDILGIGGIEIKESLTDVHKRAAQNENLDLENITMPTEIDEHEIHIFEHTKMLLEDEKIKNNKVIKLKLIEHIKEHKKLLKNKE